jgi:hypothetical protein
MAREFKETAHTKTDMQKYGENYDRIFKKDWVLSDAVETVLVSREDIEKAKSQSENNPEPRVTCEDFEPCDL